MSRARKASQSKGSSGASTTNKLLKQGREVLSDAYSQAWSTGRSLKRMGANASIRGTRRTVATVIEDNPLVLGAVGLGIGMMLGAMLPSVDMRTLGMSGGSNGSSQRKRKRRA